MAGNSDQIPNAKEGARQSKERQPRANEGSHQFLKLLFARDRFLGKHAVRNSLRWHDRFALMRFFQFKSAREKNVVLEVKMAMEIFFEIGQALVKSLVAGASLSRKLVIVGQRTD
jgi:hypothetical protein